MKKILTLLAISGMLAACKQNNLPPANVSASLSFANAIVGSAPLVSKFGNVNIIYSAVTSVNKISYGGSSTFSEASGIIPVSFIQTTDTTHTLFTDNLNLQTGGVYSLYMTGTVAQPDTVFIHENLAYHAATDSVAGIRFINLSPGTNPISVDIKGMANGSEVTALAYKGRTGFKTYKADHTVTSYVFEFRDVTLGTLLATYTLSGVNNASSASFTSTNIVRFHNLTLALIGGSGTANSVINIANY